MKSNFSTQCKSKSMVHFYINHKSNPTLFYKHKILYIYIYIYLHSFHPIKQPNVNILNNKKEREKREQTSDSVISRNLILLPFLIEKAATFIHSDSSRISVSIHATRRRRQTSTDTKEEPRGVGAVEPPCRPRVPSDIPRSLSLQVMDGNNAAP